MRWGCEALSFKILNTDSVICDALEFSVVLVLLTLAVDAQVCCVLLLLHVSFLGWKRTVTHQEVLSVLLMTKVGGHLPRIPYRQFMLLSSSQPSPPSSSSSMLSSSRQHADTQHTRTHAPAHAQAHAHPHTHTSHTLRDTQAHTHARTLTHAPPTKPKIFNIHVANGSSALLPFRRAPGGLAVRRFGIASAPAGVPGTHSWRSLGM